MRSYVCVCVCGFGSLCVCRGEKWRESQYWQHQSSSISFLSATSFLFLFSHRHCREKNLLPGESPFSFFLSFQEPRLNFTFSFFLFYLFLFWLFFFTGGCHFLSLGDGIIGAYSLLLLLTLGPVAMVALFDGNVLLLLLDFIRFDGPTIWFDFFYSKSESV